MSRYARQYGRVLLVLLPVVAIAAFLLLRPQPARGGSPFSDPFWSTNSPERLECSACSGCGCPSAPEFMPEGVSARTGELVVDFPIFDGFSFRWRSYLSGTSQVGRGMVPSWETTVEYVVLNGGNPTGPGGHEAIVRRQNGTFDVFDWDGTDYSSSSCLVTDVLTKPASVYVLTDKHGGTIQFTANGMPEIYTAASGKTTTLAWTGTVLDSIEDWREQVYTVTVNGDDYITEIESADGRAWAFTYDAYDNLETITSPATPDQVGGILTTLFWDAYHRLESIEDGRGNTVKEFAYVGVTGQIDSIDIDSETIDYGYSSGLTTRTDALGHVHRYHHDGDVVTSTDMWIASAAAFTTEYRHNGNQLVTIVMPRDNRIDLTWDGQNNLTERRFKTTDTATNGSGDLVESWVFNGSSFMTGYENSEGDAWTYTVDGAGNRTATTHPTVTNPASQSASTSATFNGLGQMLTSTNEEGTVTTYTYYSSGYKKHLLQKIEVDAAGLDLETSFDYNDAGDRISVTDARGFTTTSTFDDVGRLIGTESPSPFSYNVEFQYDGNSNLVLRRVENRDKDGTLHSTHPWIETAYTYTPLDLLATMVEDVDHLSTRTTTHGYDAMGQRILLTKPESNQEAWTYNERGLVATHVRGYGTGDASTRSYAYDTNGNMTVETDGRGGDTTHTFDLFDRRTKTTDDAGHYTQLALDENGRTTQIARYDVGNTLLQRSDRYYDERGRLWKTSDLHKDPSTTYSDAVTTFERLKTGQVETTTDALSGTVVNVFDVAGRVTGTTDQEGNETTFDLDDGGLATAWEVEEVHAGGTVVHEFEATYDALGRRTELVEIDRTNGSNRLSTTYAYDSRNLMTFTVDALGNPTRTTYDALGRMVKRERALTLGATVDDFLTAQVTQWGFDENDRLVSHADDGSNASTWTYDALDRAIEMEYPDTTTIVWDHDAEDNIVETTDAAGNVIDDTYDSLNRRTARSVTPATGFGGTTGETYTYDGLGRMTTADDDDYDLAFQHAAIGLRSMPYSEEQAYGTGTAYARTVTTTYDALGRKATEAYPTTLSLVYAYEANGLLSTIGDGSNTIATYGYVGTRPLTADFQNGTTETRTYTGFRSEVSSIHHQDSGSGTLARMDYGYNAVHDRTYERYGAGGSLGDAFEYDRMRRLTKAWMGSTNPSSPTGNAHDETVVFNMGDDGNRTSVSTTAYLGSPVVESYSSNTLNQYTAVGGATPIYDGNGNLKDDDTYTYKYDYRNQLIEVKYTGGAVIATYMYDALGRRVEKNVQGTGKTRFIYSQLETIETQTGASSTWAQSFVYGQDIDQIVMIEQADVLDYDNDTNTGEVVRNFYHRNALGSVMFISEPDETEAATYRYTPYGEQSIERGGSPQGTDPLGQLVGFTGRWRDPESGLWHYRARAYSATMGRFLQRDPLGYGPGPNVYEYCWSRPTACTDPSGMSPILHRVAVDSFQPERFQLVSSWDGPPGQYCKGAVGWAIPNRDEILKEIKAGLNEANPKYRRMREWISRLVRTWNARRDAASQALAAGGGHRPPQPVTGANGRTESVKAGIMAVVETPLPRVVGKKPETQRSAGSFMRAFHDFGGEMDPPSDALTDDFTSCRISGLELWQSWMETQPDTTMRALMEERVSTIRAAERRAGAGHANDNR